MYKLRSYFRTIPFLYKFWFSFVSKQTASLPKKDNLFYLGGYPRSGNSYFSNMLQYLFPKINFSHHLHTIAAIKIAFKINLQVFIIVRNPIDSISSLYVMKCNDNYENNDLLNLLLDDYIDYYNFLVSKYKLINFINFDTCISNPIMFLKKIESKCQNLQINDNCYKELNDYLEKNELRNKQSNMNETHSIRFSSTPNKKRSKFKNHIKDKLQELEKFQIADSVFNELQSHL